jgi:endonuclease/exonuclease/phosphatase family metal-dependent hydrolase
VQITVATFNIHKGTTGVGPAKRLRIHAVGNALSELSPDLLFLQEVQSRHRPHARRFADWPEQPQHEYLAAALGVHGAYRSNAHTRVGEHGNALLSRFPIVDVIHRDMSDHRFEQRGLLHGRVDVAGRDVHCIVIHLGLFAGSRLRQLQQVAAHVRAEVPDGAPLIVAGDFNDWEHRAAIVLKPLGLAEVVAELDSAGRSARTFPSRFPWLRLDRIYLRGFTVQQARVLRGPQWAPLSDHAPLWARVTLEPASRRG